MNITIEFEKDLEKFRSAPFLFIGSGFSRRYIGLEKWDNLLKRFCIKGMRPFDYYNSKSQSKLEVTASLMAKDYHEIWWSDQRFEKSRNEYNRFGDMINTYSPLKYEISKYLRGKSLENIEEKMEDELTWFKKIVIDGVITTNWDLLLDELFNEFDVFVGQKDLLSSIVQEIAEIYKIHGSISDFNSLILTEEDYDDFNDRNAYLAAKLLTIFIEHPIIFIGYSITDANVRQILKSISHCLTESGLNKIEDHLFFVEPIFDDKEDSYKKTYLTIDNHNLPITVIRIKNYSILYKVLAKYKRKLSTKQLKQIKAELYEIVKSNDPTSRIATIDIDEETDFEKVDFVLGVGIKNELNEQGYLGIQYDDILEDIMLDNRNFDAEKVINTLPKIFRIAYYAPFYKYLSLGNYLDKKGNLIKDIPEKVFEKFNEGFERLSTQGARMAAKRDDCEYDYSLNGTALVAHIIKHGTEQIDLDKLKKVILSSIDKIRDSKYKQRSDLRKLIRVYDWLKYLPKIDYVLIA